RSAIAWKPSSISACPTMRWPSTRRPRTTPRPTVRCAARANRSPRSEPAPVTQGSLASSLERLYHDYNREDSATDPVQLVRPSTRREDREIAGFCAAALAFGRVASVIASISTLFRIMGDRPAQFVRRFEPSEPHPELRAMVHRWTRGVDLAALLWILRQM